MEHHTRVSKAMRAVEAVYDKPIEAVLRTLYYEERLSLEEMEAVLSVNHKTIHGWMTRLGISRGQMAAKGAEMSA